MKRFTIGALVRVRCARDPFNKQTATVVTVYPDGGLLLRFDAAVSSHCWPYSPKDVRAEVATDMVGMLKQAGLIKPKETA